MWVARTSLEVAGRPILAYKGSSTCDGGPRDGRRAAGRVKQLRTARLHSEFGRGATSGYGATQPGYAVDVEHYLARVGPVVLDERDRRAMAQSDTNRTQTSRTGSAVVCIDRQRTA